MKQISEILYRFRFFICLFCFLLCIILKLHGSSISEWNKIIQPGLNNSQYSKPVMGQSRGIRMDEWAIHTPMALSQHYENYNIINSIVRAEPTNMAVVYNQPVKSFYTVLKPFYWGFFFLDEEQAFSWFWYGRLIALFIISFEFFQIITRRKRLMSLCGAVFIAFSPAVQWWFAINDFVEMLCWGELAVITVYNWFKTDNKLLQFILAAAAGLCLAGYILCFYPAWQIPFGYVFLALILWIFLSAKEENSITNINICYAVFCILTACTFVLSVIVPSFDILAVIKNTQYPGGRFDIGGGFLSYLFLYLLNAKIFTSGNVCEMAQFMGFFPLPEIMACIYLFNNRFRDKLIVLLLTVQLILCVYLIAGFPEIIAKLSLLSICSYRAAMAVSFLSLIILARLLSIDFKFEERKFDFIIPFLYSIIGFLMIYITMFLSESDIHYDLQTDISMLFYMVILPLILFIIAFLIIRSLKESSNVRTCLLIFGILLSLFVNGGVNPLMRGFNAIYEIPAYKKIKQIQEEDPGIWLVADNFPVTNFPVTAGAPDVSFTNIYPNLRLWEILDPEKKYVNEYNRYANISLQIVFNTEQTGFYAKAPDSLIIFLAAKDLSKINIKYVVSTYLNFDYKKISENVTLTKIYDEGGFRIFKLNVY